MNRSTFLRNLLGGIVAAPAAVKAVTTEFPAIEKPIVSSPPKPAAQEIDRSKAPFSGFSWYGGSTGYRY